MAKYNVCVRLPDFTGEQVMVAEGILRREFAQGSFFRGAGPRAFEFTGAVANPPPGAANRRFYARGLIKRLRTVDPDKRIHVGFTAWYADRVEDGGVYLKSVEGEA